MMLLGFLGDILPRMFLQSSTVRTRWFRVGHCHRSAPVEKSQFKPWPRLPREAVDAPPQEAFQARLDGALSNLIELKMALLTAEGLD